MLVKFYGKSFTNIFFNCYAGWDILNCKSQKPIKCYYREEEKEKECERIVYKKWLFISLYKWEGQG